MACSDWSAIAINRPPDADGGLKTNAASDTKQDTVQTPTRRSAQAHSLQHRPGQDRRLTDHARSGRTLSVPQEPILSLTGQQRAQLLARQCRIQMPPANRMKRRVPQPTMTMRPSVGVVQRPGN